MPGLASLRIPLLVELAPAQARLEAIDCALSPSQHAVGVAVAPGAGAISLGEIDPTRLDNFRTPLNPTRAQLVRTALVRVDGRAHVEVGGEQWTELRFSQSDIDHGIIKSVATRDSARASISTLLQNTTLDVQASGLTLGVGAVTSLVSNTLRAAAAPLDHVLNGVLDLLGVRVGVADVRVNGVRCGGAALVA